MDCAKKRQFAVLRASSLMRSWKLIKMISICDGFTKPSHLDLFNPYSKLSKYVQWCSEIKTSWHEYIQII